MRYADLMRGIFSLRPAFVSRVTVFGLAALLAGCQSPAGLVDTRPTGHTLIYSYLIAHGMARGSVMSGGISQDSLKGLVEIDRAALLAVIAAEQAPSNDHITQAGQAVKRLIAYIEPSDLPMPKLPGNAPSRLR